MVLREFLRKISEISVNEDWVPLTLYTKHFESVTLQVFTQSNRLFAIRSTLKLYNYFKLRWGRGWRAYLYPSVLLFHLTPRKDLCKKLGWLLFPCEAVYLTDPAGREGMCVYKYQHKPIILRYKCAILIQIVQETVSLDLHEAFVLYNFCKCWLMDSKSETAIGCTLQLKSPHYNRWLHKAFETENNW